VILWAGIGQFGIHGSVGVHFAPLLCSSTPISTILTYTPTRKGQTTTTGKTISFDTSTASFGHFHIAKPALEHMETYTSSVLVQDKSLEDRHMDGSTSIGWTFPGSPAAARGEKKTSNTNLSAVALVLLFAPCFGSFVVQAKVVQI
jgi:hypothetical protein